MFRGVIATAATILLLFVETGPARSQSHRPFAVKTPDGINISAQEWGNPNGREIVFIHGFMQSHLSWSKQIRDPGLVKQFRMISYDFRGHGGSDKIMDSNLYGNGEAYAGRHCRLYSPETDAAVFRSIGARPARGQGMALHRSRRYGLQP